VTERSVSLVKELVSLGVVGSATAVEQEPQAESNPVERINALCESLSEGFSGFAQLAGQLHEQAHKLEEDFSSLLDEMSVLTEEDTPEGEGESEAAANA